MKKALAWAVVLWVAVCSPCFGQTTLRFARIENIPDQFVGGEILKVVYNHLGIHVELVDVPAKRALLDSSSGRLDGEVHRNIRVQEQYPTLIVVRPAINYIEPSVFARKLRFDVKGWESIRDYEIGIVRGIGTSEDGTRGMSNVMAVTTLDQLMQALAADHIQVAVSDAVSGLAAMKRLGLEESITLLKPPLQRIDVYHFLHEKHRRLVPRVERVIHEMEAGGELESLRKELIDRYLSRLGKAPVEK